MRGHMISFGHPGEGSGHRGELGSLGAVGSGHRGEFGSLGAVGSSHRGEPGYPGAVRSVSQRDLGRCTGESRSVLRGNEGGRSQALDIRRADPSHETESERSRENPSSPSLGGAIREHPGAPEHKEEYPLPGQGGERGTGSHGGGRSGGGEGGDGNHHASGDEGDEGKEPPDRDHRGEREGDPMELPLSPAGSDPLLVPPTPRDIQIATAHIAEAPNLFPRYTSILVDPRFKELSGGVHMVLSLENRMPTGSYKVRGAFEEVMHLPLEVYQQGVVTASSGNHGYGVAWLAQQMGLHCVIVTPEGAPEAKVGPIRALGAEVKQSGRAYDDAYAYAQHMAQERGMYYLDLSSRFAVAGAATWVVEALEQVPRVDAVITPVGGGALINGTVTAVEDYASKRGREILVIGAEPSRSPSNYRSFQEGELITVESLPTIADGLKVNTPDAHLFPMNFRKVHEIVLVSEEDLRQGVKLLTMITGHPVEGSAVAAAMALIAGKGVLTGARGRTIDLRGKTVLTLVSGGNIDQALLDQLMKG